MQLELSTVFKNRIVNGNTEIRKPGQKTIGGRAEPVTRLPLVIGIELSPKAQQGSRVIVKMRKLRSQFFNSILIHKT
jgi:hypothetical protein